MVKERRGAEGIMVHVTSRNSRFRELCMYLCTGYCRATGAQKGFGEKEESAETGMGPLLATKKLATLT